MKKLLGVILVLSMVLSLYSPVYAEGLPLENASTSPVSNEVIFHEQGTEVKLVFSEDLTGNPIIKQYVNGTLVSEAKTILSENKVISTSYAENAAQRQASEQTIVTFTPPKRQAIAPMAFTNVGRIRYKYTDGLNSAICGVDISRETTTYTGVKYDVNGRYKDLAALVSIIVSVLDLPFFAASGVGKAILTGLGYTLSATDFIIPSKLLRSTEEENRYKLVNISNAGQVNYFVGSKYTITEESPQKNHVYYDTEYYASNAYANRDINFANTVFNNMFSYSYFTVYAWN